MKYENISRQPADPMSSVDHDDCQPSAPPPSTQQNKILKNILIQNYRLPLIVLLCLLLICVIILIAIITHKKKCPHTFHSPVSIPPSTCNYMGGTSTNNSVLGGACEHFTRIEDWDHPHNDMLETVVNAYETCCAMCWHQTSCMAFAYSSAYKICWIKTKVREDGGHFALDRISGFLGDCVEAKRQNNWDYPGNNMFDHGRNGSLPASNWQTCCGLCLRQTSCKAYTFSPSTHQCWLKTKADNGSSHLDRISGKRN